MDTGSSGEAKFDAYAQDYSTLHQESVAASGEPSDYFARYKLACLERWLKPQLESPVLDFGCGTGSLTRHLVHRCSEVHGYDPSQQSLHEARKGSPEATFFNAASELSDGHYGLAVLSGVLHHVPPAERLNVLSVVHSKLAPGSGRLVVFEHNPLNPLTRKAVADCPFDDDAVLLWPREAKRLLRNAGFRNVKRHFIVFFPRLLASLRGLEPYLGACPLGAQMMLIGTKPAAHP